MNHVMLDLETLGVSPGCAIVSIGAAFFSRDDVGKTFYATIDRASCAAVGLVEEPATLDWWARQSEAARAVLTDPSAKHLIDALYEFQYWLAKGPDQIRVWGNGATFDPPILAAAYEKIHSRAPWGPFDVRCYRTLKSFSATPIARGDGTHYHHALDDALAQARHAGALLRELNLSLPT